MSAINFDSILEEAILRCGLRKLKPKQKEAIQAFQSGTDVFISLPTAYGKSLIYGIYMVVSNMLKGKKTIVLKYNYVVSFIEIGCHGSIVVCVSPLISIMMDRRQKFVLKGISAEFMGEAQDDPNAIKKVLSGCIQLVFISPESIISNSAFRNMLMSTLYKERMVALAIDEAHCVKTW